MSGEEGKVRRWREKEMEREGDGERIRGGRERERWREVVTSLMNEMIHVAHTFGITTKKKRKRVAKGPAKI